MRLEAFIWETGGNLDEYFQVEEIITAKEMQVSNMFNKIMVVFQAQSEQSSQIQTQIQTLSDRVSCSKLLKGLDAKLMCK